MTATEPPPAAGERAAVRGYLSQYDHTAARAYDGLVDGTLLQIRLVDPDAGRVDDLVLVTDAHVEGYQFKDAAPNSTVTFSALISSGSTRAGNARPSLIRQLADGWQRLVVLAAELGVPAVRVHLVTPSLPSTGDRVCGSGQTTRSPQHFAAFVREVLGPLARGQNHLADVGSEWQPALERLAATAELDGSQLAAFLAALDLDLSAAPALPDADPLYAGPGERRRHDDIARLSAELFRRVGERRNRASTSDRGGVEPAIVLTAEDVLALPGWRTRLALRHSHTFPVDLDVYEPLADGVDALGQAIDAHHKGYVALVGPPGSGKSTLLDQSLPAREARVVRYLAFMPGDGSSRYGRTLNGDFLHDLVIGLHAAGVSPRPSLPEAEEDELRIQFAEQLHAAGEQYAHTGRRTVLVIDGLDHVRRENRAPKTLLDELPDPDGLPDGVLIVVGTQTAEPLRTRARAQLEEQPARVVNLTDRRLPAGAIAAICGRLPRAARLTGEQIRRVDELSAGHPLALAYLVNALADVPARDVDAVLDASVRYTGDIAAQYAVYWEELADRTDVIALLVDLARLRPPLDMEWIVTFADPAALAYLRSRMRHLFRGLSRRRWRFFHDSFRQHVLERTGRDVDGEFDASLDASLHRRLADLTAAAPSGSRASWQELYHAHAAGDGERVLRLATQSAMRAQFLAGRSPAAVGEDLRLALGVAAVRMDTVAVVRLLLARAELSARDQYLEAEDVPALLLDVGLIDEAADYVGVDDADTRVPIAQALRVAVRLDDLGRPEGRQLFDAFEPHDLVAHRSDGSRDEVVRSWAAGAARFRPVATVLAVVDRLLAQAAASEARLPSDRRDVAAGDEELVPFHAAVDIGQVAAVEADTAGRSDEADQFLRQLRDERASRRATLTGHKGEETETEADGALTADTHRASTVERLREDSRTGRESSDTPSTRVPLTIAEQLDSYVLSAIVAVELDRLQQHLANGNTEVAAAGARRLTDELGGGRVAVDLILELGELAAELAARAPAAAHKAGSIDGPAREAACERDQVDPDVADGSETADAWDWLHIARRVVARVGPDTPLTVTSLTDQRGSLKLAYRMRRLAYRVAILTQQRTTGVVDHDAARSEVPPGASPPSAQPAGVDVAASAPVHNDAAAIDLAARVDRLVRRLAHLHAAADASAAMPDYEIHELVDQLLYCYPSRKDGDRATLSVLLGTRRSLLNRAIAAFARHGSHALERLASRAQTTFTHSPDLWPAHDRQNFALGLARHGLRAHWAGAAITAMDAAIDDNTDVYSRLNDVAEQARAHLALGEPDPAVLLTRRLLPLSFGVYSRKDYQLEEWVGWLERAARAAPSAATASAAFRLEKELSWFAPLLVAAEPSTDGAAARACQAAVESTAKLAPRLGVRLLAYFVGHRSCDRIGAMEAVVSSGTRLLARVIAAAQFDGLDGTAPWPDAERACALLVDIVTELVVPTARYGPQELIPAVRTLLDTLSAANGSAADPGRLVRSLSEQLLCAVATRALPSTRAAWRAGLGSSADPIDRDTQALQAQEDEAPATGTESAGEDDFYALRLADRQVGRDVATALLRDVSDLIRLRAEERVDSHFRWAPHLERLPVAREQLTAVALAVEGAADAVEALLVLSRGARKLGEPEQAVTLARRALAAASEAGWSYDRGVERRSCYAALLDLAATPDEREALRVQALRDFVAHVSSAPWAAGMLMLELPETIRVLDPAVDPIALWAEIRIYLDGMRTGLTLPDPPDLTGALTSTWWIQPSTPSGP